MRRPMSTMVIAYPELRKRLEAEGKPVVVLPQLQEVPSPILHVFHLVLISVSSATPTLAILVWWAPFRYYELMVILKQSSLNSHGRSSRRTRNTPASTSAASLRTGRRRKDFTPVMSHLCKLARVGTGAGCAIARRKRLSSSPMVTVYATLQKVHLPMATAATSRAFSSLILQATTQEGRGVTPRFASTRSQRTATTMRGSSLYGRSRRRARTILRRHRLNSLTKGTDALPSRVSGIDSGIDTMYTEKHERDISAGTNRPEQGRLRSHSASWPSPSTSLSGRRPWASCSLFPWLA